MNQVGHNEPAPTDVLSTGCPLLLCCYYLVVDGNTYLINFGLLYSPKISTHDLPHANNVTFNNKYGLVAIRLFTVEKDFRKTTKNI